MKEKTSILILIVSACLLLGILLFNYVKEQYRQLDQTTCKYNAGFETYACGSGACSMTPDCYNSCILSKNCNPEGG